jgi:hypothetical protein
MIVILTFAPRDRDRSGRSVARLSRLLWEQEVASSNLAAPTKMISKKIKSS